MNYYNNLINYFRNGFNDFEYKIMLSMLEDEPNYSILYDIINSIGDMRYPILDNTFCLYHFNRLLKDKYSNILDNDEELNKILSLSRQSFHRYAFHIYDKPSYTDLFKEFFKKNPQSIDLIIEHMSYLSVADTVASTYDFVKRVSSCPSQINLAYSVKAARILELSAIKRVI